MIPVKLARLMLFAALWFIISSGVARGQAEHTGGSPPQADVAVQTPQSGGEAHQTVAISPQFHGGAFEEINYKILVHVKLNGERDARMVLDSGASCSVLSATAVKALGLKLIVAKEQREIFHVGRMATVEIAGAVLQNVIFIQDPSGFIDGWNRGHPKTPIDGVIGLDTLEQCAVGLDMVSHTLGIWTGGKLTPEDAAAFNSLVRRPDDNTTLVLAPGTSSSGNGKPISNPAMSTLTPQKLPLDRAADDPLYHTSILEDGTPLSLYLDTGAPDITITETMAKRLNPLVVIESNVDFSFEKHTFKSALIWMRRFQIGSLIRSYLPIVVVHRPKERPTDALMGITSFVFEDCRVILDFPGHALYLSPYDAQSENPFSRLAARGICLDVLSRDRHSIAIIPGSPAEKIGLRTGDELESVGDKTWAQMADLPDEGKSLLDQNPLIVTIRRRHEARPLKFTLPAGTPP